MSVQTILIPKSKFNKNDAIMWIISHRYHIYKIDDNKNFWRIRQREPQPHGNYYTITLPNKIELVYEKNI